jgi:hypothetical protein
MNSEIINVGNRGFERQLIAPAGRMSYIETDGLKN